MVIELFWFMAVYIMVDRFCWWRRGGVLFWLR